MLGQLRADSGCARVRLDSERSIRFTLPFEGESGLRLANIAHDQVLTGRDEQLVRTPGLDKRIWFERERDRCKCATGDVEQFEVAVGQSHPGGGIELLELSDPAV